jgi:hypothetical protein
VLSPIALQSAVQFPDVCFGGAPGLEAAEQLADFFPTMDLHFAGGVALRAGPLNYLFVHAAQVHCLLSQQSFGVFSSHTRPPLY